MFYFNLSGRKSYTLKNYGSHIWNLLSKEIKSCTEINKLIFLLIHGKVQSANATFVMH